jgi:Tfp pilus assembly protein PilF
MTAAFAKAMGLPVQYNSVEVEENWTRNGDLYFAAGHVNLTLGKSPAHWRPLDESSPQLMIDFLPQAEMKRLHVTPVDEATVVALYMNNRAAETLAGGQVAQAYAWARAAVLQDRNFLPAYNTLGVIYQRHGKLPQAEQVFAHLLGREPGNTKVMANLVRVLEAQGRHDDAKLWSERLAAMEPHPPFEYFRAGMAAMRAKDYKTAREQFAREVARAPENDEFHFWLALAHMGLGEVIEARRQLMRAVETSSTSQSRNVYVAKLDKLRALETH